MPLIQWYPGHIAKAERQLKEQLKRVDVVLEMRDARIPLASHHPELLSWIGSKPRILVINRIDLITPEVQKEWLDWFRSQGEQPYFTNAKTGLGVKAILKGADSVGKQVNQKRAEKGMMPRAVRAVVIGFPNVGKSALINRLLGRKIVASARRAGVTRQLRWVRVGEVIELLDAPGIIPVKLNNQDNAVKLAICEDIGDASYDNQRVAVALLELLMKSGYQELLTSQYQLEVGEMTGEDYLYQWAEKRYKGDQEKSAVKLLNDFRTGVLGAVSLELPAHGEIK